MKSRKRVVDSSLELLLDTICNTFGGILFLAMLVVLTLQMTPVNVSQSSESATRPADVEAARRMVDLEEKVSSAKLDALRTNVETADARQPGMEEIDAELESLSKKRTELEHQREKLRETAKESESSSQQITEANSKLTKDVSKAQEELRRTGSQIGEDVEKRSRVVFLPRLRESFKRQVTYCLRHGKLYRATHLDGSTNLEDMEVGDEEEIWPRRSAGVGYEDSPKGRLVVRDKLGSLDPQFYAAAIFVWPDSFEQFGPLRAVLVDSNVQYRLEVMQEDSRIVRGATSYGRLVQ